MRLLSILILTTALLGCENANRQYARRYAESVGADCARTPAPNPKAAGELRRLCACTVTGLAASDIAISDSDEVLTTKLHRVQDACLREVYGDEPETIANTN